MRGHVAKHFVCRLTGRPYRPGEVYVGEQDRLEELARGGFVELLGDPDEACDSGPAREVEAQKSRGRRKGRGVAKG